MSQETIGQRLKFLMDSLNLKVRTFANALDVSETNIRNYLTRDSKPSADILERIVRQYSQVNAHWLITGESEPFLPGAAVPDQSTTINPKNSLGKIRPDSSNAPATSGISLEACQRALTTAQSESALLREQLASKEALLAAKDVVIAAKDETISLLRGGYTRPSAAS